MYITTLKVITPPPKDFGMAGPGNVWLCGDGNVWEDCDPSIVWLCSAGSVWGDRGPGNVLLPRGDSGMGRDEDVSEDATSGGAVRLIDF